MSHPLRFIPIAGILLSCEACTVHLDPHGFEPTQVDIPTSIKPIAVHAKLSGSPDREQHPAEGITVTTNDDEFTRVLVERLIDGLENRNIPIHPGAGRLIELQVVHVGLQPAGPASDKTIHCIIDFNRKLGNAPAIGFQAQARHRNYETACDLALRQAAEDIIYDPDTLNYLKKE